jgi:hypothetical protein
LHFCYYKKDVLLLLAAVVVEEMEFSLLSSERCVVVLCVHWLYGHRRGDLKIRAR